MVPTEICRPVVGISKVHPSKDDTSPQKLLPKPFGLSIASRLLLILWELSSHLWAWGNYLIPRAKPLTDTLDAAEYFAGTTGTGVKLNYVLVAGSNASHEDARRLGQLLKSRKGLTLKISQLNSPDRSLVVPETQADEFEQIVKSHGVKTCCFVNHGQDINPRCGEFVIFQQSIQHIQHTE